MKPSEVLEKYGWAQGAMYADETGYPCSRDKAVRFCAVGAIEKSGIEIGHSISKLQAHIDGVSIPSWNDTPGRTKDEVIAALKACNL